MSENTPLSSGDASEGSGRRTSGQAKCNDQAEPITITIHKSKRDARVGVTLYPVPSEKVPWNWEGRGACITDVHGEGVAAKTGLLQRGDTILSIDGQKVDAYDGDNKCHELCSQMLRESEGDLTLTILRSEAHAQQALWAVEDSLKSPDTADGGDAPSPSRRSLSNGLLGLGRSRSRDYSTAQSMEHEMHGLD